MIQGGRGGGWKGGGGSLAFGKLLPDYQMKASLKVLM